MMKSVSLPLLQLQFEMSNISVPMCAKISQAKVL